MLIRYLQEVRISCIAGADEVDFRAEDFFEFALEAEKTIRERFAVSQIEFVKEIDVAPGRIECSACRRTEQLQFLHAVFPAQLCYLVPMLFDELKHNGIVSSQRLP